jgi:predicted dehydrogenase
MTNNATIRIGIIGAGAITLKRHLPGFRAIRGVEIVGVCNRFRESSARVAREFDIPKIFTSWEHLIDDDAIDAVVIGTWPYLHCAATLAALGAGKHVLTQARMAMNAREAQRMLDKSKEVPAQVAMVVPSPYGLTGDNLVRKLIADGFLGAPRELHVDGLTSELADPRTPIGWRQQARYSGFNMLTLGILHETARRWTAPANRVIASASKLIPTRPNPDKGGHSSRVGTPDSVHVLTTQSDGSRGIYRLSAVTYHGPGLSIALYGSDGSLIYDLTRDEIRAGSRKDSELKPLSIPKAIRGGWSVEADFIAAIREGKPVTHTTFADGVEYMQFTEAVARSSRHTQPVDLPLQEFSNPSL